jgi:methionyl-tRNA synthetase
MTERVAVFVAWPYANGPIHIGHLGGALLPADIFARYQRLLGRDVIMVSGSDTHGTPVSVKAESEGRSPQDVYRQWHADFLDTFLKMGISFDLFTHTDTANHRAVAQALFRRLVESGALVLGTYQQLYAPGQGRYLPDRFVEGTCPFCGYTGARGDQCDQCGRLLDATQLIEPRARTGTGEALEVREREHYFLDLPRFSATLGAWLETKDDWRAAVRNASLGQIREGLTRRAITRDLDWGIPVPLPGWEDKVLYVWFEALMGYLSGSIELAQLSGRPDDWRRYWYDASATAYYFMGKDNTTFHALIWPTILLGAGQYEPAPGDESGLSLPTDVVANEYVNLEGEGMSTSRNWALWVNDLMTRYDPDPLRFYLTLNAPETRDVDFTWLDFARSSNNELLATWGNLVNRVLKLTLSKAGGVVPSPGPLDAADEAILARTAAAFDQVGAGLAARRFKVALADAMAVAHDTNRYLNDKAPWLRLAEDPAGAKTTLYVALRAIDDLKTLLAPFLPFTSQRVHHDLGYDGDLFGRQYVETVSADADAHTVLRYDAAGATGRWAPGDLPVGQALRPPTALFTKLEEAVVVESERARLAAQSGRT